SIVHDILWKWSLTLLVFFMWLIWFKSLKGEKEGLGIGSRILEKLQ
ncbi:MAG: hypothetical protein ABEK04_05070, partial [Candidatus Nanohalobium sp.]